MSGAGRLAGSTAIVTGAGSGIGREIARLFASEGASVAVVDLNGDAAAETAAGIGGDALALTADIADDAQVRRTVEAVIAARGAVHVLVNNAGVMRPGPVAETTDEAWRTNLDVNLTGAFQLCRAVLPGMVEQRRGSIVSISSGAALRPPPQRAAYATSKSALIGLTLSIAADYGPDGIRANCILPGQIETPLSAKKLSQPGVRERVAASVPLRRIGRPSDIAKAVLFLSCDESEFITGQTLGVDGGIYIPSPTVPPPPPGA